MDILEQEINKNKKQPSNKKKMVLTLLIICIFILVILLALVTVLKGKGTVKKSFFVNGLEVELKDELIIEDEAGTKYISLEEGAELIGSRYFNGEYGKNEEDRNKCYIQNTNEAIGFELDSNKIYKVELSTNIEPQYFEMANNVIKSDNGKLYATIEDFSKACNVAVGISEDGNKIEMNTCDYLYEAYSTSIQEDNKYTSMSDDYNNKKAIYYGMLVVNDGANYGVIDTNKETVIGAKYKKITFNEFTQSFIAMSNNKYGVLSNEGKVKIEFKYDSIRIIKYSPLLYEVKQNNKYGVLNDKGEAIINIEYDSLGYKGNEENGSVLIIEGINSGKDDGMIVYKDGKYGIASIKTGDIILECELEKIYSKTSQDDKITYYVQIKGYDYTLEEYIKYVNTTVVNLPNQ